MLVLENVLSNYAYVGLMAAVTLFLTPVYVRLLGPLEWGAVALCITFQSALFLLDAGLGQVAPREFAAMQSDRRSQYALYLRFRQIYGVGALAAWMLSQLVVDGLVRHLHPEATESGLWAVRLILTQFALTFANSAPLGLWNGLQMQKRVNLRQAGFMALKHAGALACVSYVAPQAWAYVLPFVAVGCVETAFNWWTVRHEYRDQLSSSDEVQVPSLQGLLSHVGGFGIAVLVGMLTSQIDRLYLASHLSLKDFGVYALAVTFGLAFMNLQQPLQKAFLPRVVASQESAKALFLSTLVICALPCLLVAWRAQDVLHLWLRTKALGVEAGHLLSLVLVGVAFNGLYAADYTRMVASRAWRPILLINGLILLTQFVILSLLAPAIGMLAGGWAWVACGVMQFALAKVWFARIGDARG
ncbi:MAG: oligosaccharide flippase family protein [Aquabacterium sp.]